MVGESGELWTQPHKIVKMDNQSQSIMLRGIHTPTLDNKGRFALPSRLRPELADYCDGELVVTVDVDEPCLLIYPKPDWEIVQAKLMSLPSLNPQVRRLQRLLMGQAADLKLDSAGRVLLPAALREHAKLDHQITLMGLGNKFELWDAATWQQTQDAYREEMGQLDSSEVLQDLSL